MYDIDLHFISTLLKEQAYCCAISKIKLTFTKGEGHIPTNASIDRIDPHKGYTKDNVQIVAWQVNTPTQEEVEDTLERYAELAQNPVIVH